MALIQEAVEGYFLASAFDVEKAPYKKALEHLEDTMEAIVPLSSTLVPTN